MLCQFVFHFVHRLTYLFELRKDHVKRSPSIEAMVSYQGLMYNKCIQDMCNTLPLPLKCNEKVQFHCGSTLYKSSMVQRFIKVQGRVLLKVVNPNVDVNPFRYFYRQNSHKLCLRLRLDLRPLVKLGPVHYKRYSMLTLQKGSVSSTER